MKIPFNNMEFLKIYHWINFENSDKSKLKQHKPDWGPTHQATQYQVTTVHLSVMTQQMSACQQQMLASSHSLESADDY